MKRGYLVFTTHDRDELDTTFVPESETKVLDALRKHDGRQITDDHIQQIFTEWVDNQQPEPVRWWSQTRCEFSWPFNGYTILGTFYFLVY